MLTHGGSVSVQTAAEIENSVSGRLTFNKIHEFQDIFKIQYQYTKLLRCTSQNNFFASADFQILHSSVFNRSGSDVKCVFWRLFGD